MTERNLSIDGDEIASAETSGECNAGPALSATEHAEAVARYREHQAHLDRTYKRLLQDAQTCYRAMSLSPQLDAPEAWEKTVAKALDDYRSGRALMDQLGADKLLDAPTAGLLLAIRRGLIEETGAETASEMLLIDLAVIAHANAMRFQTMIANAALIIESEMFGQQSMRAKWRSTHGSRYETIAGLAVEDHIRALKDKLMPLVEKFHRLAREHIETIDRFRRKPAVSVERERAINLVLQNGNGSSTRTAAGRACD
jgi:hypothetical protein